MLYREMGKTGEKVSSLGFGCMRLPIKGSYDVIDVEKSTELLDYALDQGINYLDTAYPYHGSSLSGGGQSEIFLGEYFTQSGRRDEIHLATKLPTWLLENEEDPERFLTEQLKRLQTDCIDFYLLHSLKEKQWFHLEDIGVLEFLDQALSDGRIKYAGFSTHDGTNFIKEIIDSYNWDMCQIQYNYLDENIQAGKEGLQYAAEKGLGIVVMEPLKGGVLANYVPTQVQKIWNESRFERTPAEWAFRYVWNIPEVSVVLSGMNTMSQLQENINTSASISSDAMTTDEKEIMEQVKKVYRERITVDCSSCAYCMPCPSGINIPQCLSYLIQAEMLDDYSEVRNQYYFMLKETELAENCLECGLCEEICSQSIPIREKLREVTQKMGN
jgi:uncharacterized protein